MDDALDLPLLSPGEGPPGRPAGGVLRLRRGTLDLRRRIGVMGIVNRTPDSFYDAGETFALDAAVRRVLDHAAAGADIVDVGGVKGGPGSEVTAGEEIDRVVPVVRAARARACGVVLSVDTFRAEVADAALDAGADMVNDVTGGHDPDLLGVVADHEAGYVAVHHGGTPRTRPFRHGYPGGVVAAVVDHLRALTTRAQEQGVAADRILVDPGHDFQKTTYHSLTLSRRLPALLAVGFPVLVALSNKDFVGETLDAKLEGRVDGSIAAAVVSVVRGARVLRVHEVARTVAAVRMTEALLGWRRPAVAVRGLE